MINKNQKRKNLKNKRRRIKNKLKIGSFPRLVVFRSNVNIFAQIIDDNIGNTLVSSSSIDQNIKEEIKNATGKIQKSIIVGKTIGEKAKNIDISRVIFDRNGYKYHGRVKAVADAARETGLQF